MNELEIIIADGVKKCQRHEEVVRAIAAAPANERKLLTCYNPCIVCYPFNPSCPGYK